MGPNRRAKERERAATKAAESAKRAEAERRLGAQFDIRAFHGTVLGNGAVPLGVLDQLVTDWAGQMSG